MFINDRSKADRGNDGIDRRGFLKCMAWAGTGVVWTLAGACPSRACLPAIRRRSAEDFAFVQISDSHIGFNKPANPDVTGTLQAAVDKINALPQRAGFHHSHRRSDTTVEAGEFDTLDQVSERRASGRCSTCPASTTSPATTASNIWSATARRRREAAGTASITRASTLSD